ncbi:MAG: hypothetical protein GXN93_00190 [Candidatus Diapherotrites archaeon]|nr:hypothetical protein [Candidatus Diapherotrites archaeon]
MRQILLYLLVVTFVLSTAAASDLNVVPGHVYELNILVEYPIPQDSAWAGVYGDVSIQRPLDGRAYPGPFGYFTVSHTVVRETNSSSVELVSGDKLAVSDTNNWYIAFSTRKDVNFDDLRSSCDVDIDSILEGKFCGLCLPSETLSKDANIFVRNREYCAREAVLYGGAPAYLLLDSNGDPVFLAKLGDYNILGEMHNFGAILDVPTSATEYVYLVRARVFCGDGVCDPGEMSCSDCRNLVVSVSPTSRDVNVSQSATYSGQILNNGYYATTIQSLALDVVSGDGNAISYSFSYPDGALPKLVGTGGDWNFALSISASQAGDYSLRAVATDIFGVQYKSNEFTLHVAAPPRQEVNEVNTVQPPVPAGEANAPSAEKNQVIKLKTGGYYVPWARCISFVRINGPDRVNSKLEENVSIDLYIQNGGTCDENVDIEVHSTPSEEFTVDPKVFELKKGQGRTITLHVVPKHAGLHSVVISAKGLVDVDHQMQLFVSNQVAPGAEHGNCRDDVAILAPDKLVVQEGQSVGSIVVRNMGTCRDRVHIFVEKVLNGAAVPIDRKDFYLTGGEAYTYHIPQLAAGEYKITVSAGGNTHVSQITVTPKPLVGGMSEFMSRASVAMFAVLLLVLIFAAGYVRYKYLS